MLMIIPTYVLTYLAITKSYNLYKKYQIYSIENTIQSLFSNNHKIDFYKNVEEYFSKQQYQITKREATFYVWDQWNKNGLIQQALSN